MKRLTFIDEKENELIKQFVPAGLDIPALAYTNKNIKIRNYQLRMAVRKNLV